MYIYDIFKYNNNNNNNNNSICISYIKIIISDTVRALSDALKVYEGTVLAVSHDEAFVNSLLDYKSESGESSNFLF